MVQFSISSGGYANLSQPYIVDRDVIARNIVTGIIKFGDSKIIIVVSFVVWWAILSSHFDKMKTLAAPISEITKIILTNGATIRTNFIQYVLYDIICFLSSGGSFRIEGLMREQYQVEYIAKQLGYKYWARDLPFHIL